MASHHTHECRDCGSTCDVGCLSDKECFWTGGNDGCPVADEWSGPTDWIKIDALLGGE